MVSVIHADAHGREIGYLEWCEGDFTVGRLNTFELRVPPSDGVRAGDYLMVEGTEYGGVVDGMEVDTTRDYVTASGRTWHGLLATTVVVPDPGSERLVLTGEINAVLGRLVERQGLGLCMAASGEDSGMRLDGYGVSRASSRMDAYTVVTDALRSVGAKLRVRYDGGLRRAVLSAVPRAEYVSDGLDGNRGDFVVRTTRPYNHLHCMGLGEGTARAIVDVYADADGNVSTTQTLFGSDHKAKVYENTNLEADELLAEGMDELRDLQEELRTCSVVSDGSERYDIGDIVGGVSVEHGVDVTTAIASIVATVGADGLTLETKTETEV